MMTSPSTSGNYCCHVLVPYGSFCGLLSHEIYLTVLLGKPLDQRTQTRIHPQSWSAFSRIRAGQPY
ncbi:hypothetical protein BDW68DRAFT_129862 [Aspergillus falconensis]